MLVLVLLFFSLLEFLLNIGRVCHGPYHWRCVEPKTISKYGENANFICDNCNDGSASDSPHRICNGNSNYQDFAHIPTKANLTETNVANNIRYFEEKQQQFGITRIAKLSDIDHYLPSHNNETDYHHLNGKI